MHRVQISELPLAHLDLSAVEFNHDSGSLYEDAWGRVRDWNGMPGGVNVDEARRWGRRAYSDFVSPFIVRYHDLCHITPITGGSRSYATRGNRARRSLPGI